MFGIEVSRIVEDDGLDGAAHLVRMFMNESDIPNQRPPARLEWRKPWRDGILRRYGDRRSSADRAGEPYGGIAAHARSIGDMRSWPAAAEAIARKASGNSGY
jgi:hypothetical protein